MKMLLTKTLNKGNNCRLRKYVQKVANISLEGT